MVSLTPNERDILEFIQSYINHQGLSPTFTEIQRHFEYASVNSVQNYIRQLVKKKYLSLEPHQKRALKILAPSSAFTHQHRDEGHFMEVPIYAKVAAGAALEYQVLDRTILVDRQRFGRINELFAVEVVGDSMIDDGILEGDFLLVQKSAQIEKGMTAVVTLESGGSTVKRLYLDKKNSKIELRPANNKYQSKFIEFNQLKIEGKVVGLMRYFI
jgi:repressor LexA